MASFSVINPELNRHRYELFTGHFVESETGGHSDALPAPAATTTY
jgi:hypothetical protein